MQVFQLPQRRRRKAEPVHYLWSQKDFHTGAYTILLDARSARISEALGAPQPQSSARCTVCHSPFQSVAADPELVFELLSQSNNEPKHWRDNDPASGPQSWLVGQAVALREIIWAVNNATGQQRDRLFTQASALTWLLDKPVLAEISAVLARSPEFSCMRTELREMPRNGARATIN